MEYEDVDWSNYDFSKLFEIADKKNKEILHRRDRKRIGDDYLFRKILAERIMDDYDLSFEESFHIVTMIRDAFKWRLFYFCGSYIIHTSDFQKAFKIAVFELVDLSHTDHQITNYYAKKCIITDILDGVQRGKMP